MPEPDDILGYIPSPRRTGDDPFHIGGVPTEHTLGGFWQWSCSDLLANTQRAVLAEYIVSLALGDAAQTRPEWRAWDVELADGERARPVRVEVKASGAIQSWAQQRLSPIKFDIAPKGAWTAADGAFDSTRVRRSDVYVFCVLGSDSAVPDPLNLDEWSFYVLSSRVLEERIPDQKSILLSSLLRLGPTPAAFADLRAAVIAAAQPI